VVLPYDMECMEVDEECAARVRDFEKIASEMKAGKASGGTFLRTDARGSVEKMHVSYAPITAAAYRPIDGSDFTRGTTRAFRSLVYSLALAQPNADLMEPFRTLEGDIQRQVNICIGVLAALIVVSAALLLYISFRMTESIIHPVLHLLAMVKNVNRIHSEDHFKPLNNYAVSREVVAIYHTFSMLFKVVRFANAAFFSGDIDGAYWVLVDAHRLFCSLNNKKAIGVASNNLGNCLLAMYRTMDKANPSGEGSQRICGLSKADIIARGTAYFNVAIKLGEEAYDRFYEEEGWSANCLVFMQHLSNRYFNRAIFLLTVKDDHPMPKEAERLGFRDLEIVMDMDVEVASQCLEVGFTVDKVEKFELSVSRIRGLLSLLEISFKDEWELEELIGSAFRELKAALRNVDSDLFAAVSPAGRMQQLDTELIMYAQLCGRKEEAARVAIRMLLEDEFVLYDAQCLAVKALVDFVHSEDDGDGESGSNYPISAEAKDELDVFNTQLHQDVLETIIRRVSDANKEEEGSIDVSGSLRKSRISRTGRAGQPFSSSRSRLSLSLKETTRGDFTMEAF